MLIKEYKNDYLCYVDINETIQSFKEESNKKKKGEKEESKDVKSGDNKSKGFFSMQGFSTITRWKKILHLYAPQQGDIRDEETSVYLLDISTKKFRKLNIHGIFSSNIAFSPDGNKIVFAKTPKRMGVLQVERIWENYILEIYDLEKEETIMRLSEFDRSVTPIKWTSKRNPLQPGRIEQTIELEWFLKKVSSIYSKDECLQVDADSTSDGENSLY